MAQAELDECVSYCFMDVKCLRKCYLDMEMFVKQCPCGEYCLSKIFYFTKVDFLIKYTTRVTLGCPMLGPIEFYFFGNIFDPKQ